MTTGTKKRRRYSPQSKKLYVEKVNEFKEKGTMSSDDCYKKAGQIALGTDGNSFSYRNWAKQLGIETVSMNPGHRPPQDNAEDEKKPKQAEKKPATDTKGHRYNARGHRIYTDAEKQDLIDRVADMMSRGIPAQKAIALASKTILGKVIPDTQFYRWRKQAAERKADKLGVTKAATKAKQLEAMSVTAITDWLKGVDDADVLIDLQEALDVRKAEVHEAVEQQAEILLAQLSKLAPRKAKPQPPAESTTTDVLRTGQEQPPSQAE